MQTSAPLHSDRRYALGIDVGGTKIAGGIVDLSSGEITARRQVPTDYPRGGAAILADTVTLARDLKAEAALLGLPVTALGVGVAELVDRAGRVFSDHRIRWTGFDVQGAFAAVLPCVVSADVRAAALAEARFGAGRAYRDFYFVTIGTGVSGTLVLDGFPYAGSRGAALVIANTANRHSCPDCGHVSAGMVEDVASGPGLAAAYGVAEAEAVLAAAAQGDARAIRVIGHATTELGRVLALLADGLDPEAIVIGGGLGSAPGAYFDSLVTAIRTSLWDGVDHPLPVLQAALGQDAGLIGAAYATVQKPEPAHRPVHQTIDNREKTDVT